MIPFCFSFPVGTREERPYRIVLTFPEGFCNRFLQSENGSSTVHCVCPSLCLYGGRQRILMGYLLDFDMKNKPSMIDLQKDFLANKRVVEDTARRTYLLEMLMTARRATPSEQREGYITYVKEKQVAISLGAKAASEQGIFLRCSREGAGRNRLPRSESYRLRQNRL